MPSERHEARDFFGNTMTALSFHAPIDRIELTLQATAERLVPPDCLDLSPVLPGLAAEIAGCLRLDAAAPHHFLGPSTRVASHPAITAFAKDLAAPGMTAVQVVEAVGRAINTEIRFDATATDVHTPPAEAFANRHGVCQDFSHVMIAALRPGAGRKPAG